MSVFVPHEPATNRTLSLNEHKSILRKLMKGKNVEQTLKSLYIHRMDEKLEESGKIVEVLINLCNNSPIGRIAEYTVRHWLNSDGSNYHPITYEWEKRIVIEEKQKCRSSHKSGSLGLELLHWQMTSKIKENPVVFEREKETEQFLELMAEDICFEKVFLKRKFEEEEESCPILPKISFY